MTDRMRLRILTILVIALAAVARTEVQAQRATETPPAFVPPQIQGGPAPFEPDLMRLSEILGALQYLRALCGANEGQKWREQMQALLDAEAHGGEFQPWLSKLPADLSHLHPGRECRGAPLSRRGLEDFPRDHGALHQLIPAINRAD